MVFRAEIYDYPSILASILEHGFRWREFSRIFPFGFLGIREGEYLELVNAALDSMSCHEERQLLIDILDAQWCVYVEQLWAGHQFSKADEADMGENHFALARLQIGETIRKQRGYRIKSGRRVMNSLIGKTDTLLDRMQSG